MKPVKNTSVLYQIGDIIQPHPGGLDFEIIKLQGDPCRDKCVRCYNEGRLAQLRCIPSNRIHAYCLNGWVPSGGGEKPPWILVRRKV